MVQDQDVTHNNGEPESRPPAVVATTHGGNVATKAVGSDNPSATVTTYPSSTHPDGAIPYA